jgi:periplasmic divalent cation tolerance protein
MEPDVMTAMITCPPDKAAALAEALVAEGVAACVNIVPGIESVYRWHGKLQRDTESLLIAKTTAGRFEALKQVVLKHHPYEVPEIIGLAVAAGHAPYLAWIVESTT